MGSFLSYWQPNNAYFQCGWFKRNLAFRTKKSSSSLFLTQTRDLFTIPQLLAQTAEPVKVDTDRGSVSAQSHRFHLAAG